MNLFSTNIHLPTARNTIKTHSKYTMTRKQRSNHQTSPKYNYNAAPKCNSNTAKIYNIIEIQSRESAELQQDNEEEYNFNTAQIT